MSLDQLLPARGTSLLIGQPGAWQQALGQELVFGHAVAGGTIIWLVEREHDARQLTANIAAWRIARDIAPDVCMHIVSGLEPERRTPKEYHRAIMALGELPNALTLIVKDISRNSVGYDRLWLDTARDLADALETSVLTISSTPDPYFDAGDCADIVLKCEALTGLNCRIVPVRPKDEPIILEGREANRMILFTPKIKPGEAA